MKKIYILGLILLVVVSLSSCLTTSMMFSGVKQDNTISGTDIVYSTYTKYFEDLENPFYTIKTSFPMEDDYKILKDDVMTLQIFYTFDYNIGGFEIVYEGSSWRFMKGNMKYKVDDTIYNFIDEQPDRDVLSGGDVKEKISNYPLVIEKDEEFLTDIGTCNNIMVQYYGEPYSFEEEEVRIVNDFFTKYFNMSYEKIGYIHNN